MGELNEAHQPKYLTRTPLASVDWDSFFDAVHDAFKLHLASVGPPGQKAPVLVSEFPKTNEGHFDTAFDVILFHILGSTRAATDPSNKRRFPKGPTTRDRIPHPTKDRYSLITIGWWEMMDVEFTVYSLSHDRANEITKWFHKMMIRYIFDLSFFKARGVHYMTFEKRGPDVFSKAFGQELHVRTLDYNVRLELLQSFEIKDLEAVNIQLNETEEISLVEQYIVPKP